MNKKILFFAIILGSVSIAFSQDTSTDQSLKEKIEQRIQGDSITYSWSRANHFVNGLKAESKLRVLVGKLKNENSSLEKAYQSSQRRVISYQDTIVPTLNKIILNKNKEIGVHELYEKTLISTIRKQSFKKWIWLFVGTAIGIVVSTL